MRIEVKAIVIAIVATLISLPTFAQTEPIAPTDPAVYYHYAPNGNWTTGQYDTGPGASGFNIADVESPGLMPYVPSGVKALVFLGMCTGDTGPAGAFEQAVNQYKPYAGSVFGFYLMDDPDPASCSPGNLQTEAWYIHQTFNDDAVVFIALQNLGTFTNPAYCDSGGCYNNATTNIDYFGVSPYPCRSELNNGAGGCDMSAIARFYAAAKTSGLKDAQIVPIYQTFGGGGYVDDAGGTYLMPTITQLGQILAAWGAVFPTPETPYFDFAYSWGSQQGDQSIATDTDMQSFFLQRNDDSFWRFYH